MTESDKKNKKLSVSHNKSKSGTESILKFNLQNNNIFNVKSGNLIKGKINYNFTKFKSISPKIKRRNCIDVGIKEKRRNKSKSQSQSRSKSKNKSHNKNDINAYNNLIINTKNNTTNKQKSFKEKMNIILSKNIIALTRKKRKSPSPKIRISRPSLIKNIINNPQNKNLENIKNTNGNQGRKSKNSPSSVSFRFSNGGPNYVYKTNTNYQNKKAVLTLNNNISNQNVDNLLLINNRNKIIIRKKINGNSPKYLINQNSTEQYDNISMKINDKIYYQNSSYSNKKNNFPFKNKSNYNTGTNNNNKVNHNILKVQKIQNKKIKNIVNIYRNNINMNICKYDDEYNSINDRRKSLNVNILKGNKRPNNAKNSLIGNMILNEKNIIINDINKKNNIIVNNIKIKNNSNMNTIKKQMTIIQNFSKYKKKGALNIVNKNNTKANNCHNENISNNYYEDKKVIINEGNAIKKNKNLNINNIANRKNDYNHSQPKITDNANNCYTN